MWLPLIPLNVALWSHNTYLQIGMILLTALVATFVWKFVEFACVANALVGDHMMHCSQCKQPVLTFVSPLVADMLNKVGQHKCKE